MSQCLEYVQLRGGSRREFPWEVLGFYEVSGEATAGGGGLIRNHPDGSFHPHMTEN